MAALEGLAAGVPVVASSVGGLPELLEHGRSGVLVPVGDAARLAEAILALLRDSRLASVLSERGPVRARQFALDVTLEAYLSLYDEVLGRSRPVRD